MSAPASVPQPLEERAAVERPAAAPQAAEAPRAPSARRLRAGILAVIGIGGAAAIGVSLATGGPRTLATAARLPLAALAAVVALDVASWGGEALVFASLAGVRGVRGWLRMVVVYVGGGFPGFVTPFGSGSIPGWIYALTREGLTAGEATAVVGARGLITSAFFVVSAALAAAVAPAALGGSPASLAGGVAALVVVLAIVVAVVVRPRQAAALLSAMAGGRAAVHVLGADRAARAAAAVEREAERFATSLAVLARRRPGALAMALAGVLVSRACLLAILPVLLAGLGWHGALVPLLLAVVAVWVVASGSPTPGGTGAAEAALTAALSTVAPVATAGAAALLWRGITFYFELTVGWVLFALVVTRRR